MGLKHIAIIMDGNGRWAKQRGLIRTSGHQKGVESVRDVTKFCASVESIEYLSLYAFSTENWKRPKTEVEFLMSTLKKYLKKELPVYLENSIRLKTIGDLSGFSDGLIETIEETKEATKNGDRLTQILALNYGAKDEILRACKRVAQKHLPLNEQNLELSLDTGSLPPVDMLIRTGGEKRLSNFMLWQAAYAELFFTETFWPDFNSSQLESMIEEFYKRERRFGGL
ncbi:MAG: di-trans,poly-cis-decaprenylcistransferase [Campylobacterales bacterium]